MNGMRWVSAISEATNLEKAVDECIQQAATVLEDDRPDLVVAFVGPGHEVDQAHLPGWLEPLRARCVLATSAGGVIGGGREIEGRAALSLTAAVLPGVRIEEISVDSDDLPDPLAGSDAWRESLGLDSQPAEGILLLADPFSFDTQELLLGLDASFPGVPVIGGLASGGREAGQNLLVLQDEARHSGAVGVSFRGNLCLDTVVAQGCRPIGVPMFVTRSHRNLIQELDGRPPNEIVRELYQTLNRRDQDLLQHSLFLGIVMRPALEQYLQGDFLIRNVLGFDRDQGYLAVGAIVQEQQVVQFHLRDAHTSRDDLESHLQLYREQQQDRRASGALLFSCLGRGERLYGVPDHDSRLFHRHMGPLPLAGFFCNGEIGPVQGRTFLHGYTSSFGLFRPKL